MFDRSYNTGSRPARGWLVPPALLLLATLAIHPAASARPARQSQTPTPVSAAATPTPPPPVAPAPSAIGLWTPAGPTDADFPTVNAIAMDGPALAETTSIVIATDRGVYRTSNGGASWSDWNTGLSSRDIQALVSNSAGTFYAAANGLVYRRTSGAATWSDYSTNLPTAPAVVGHLAISADGTLFAAARTSGSAGMRRVFRRPAGALGWTDFSAGMPADAITALAVGAAEVYIGTAHDLFASPRDQPGWASIRTIVATSLPLNDNGVGALAVGPDDELYVGLVVTNSAGSFLGGVWRTSAAGCPAHIVPSRSTECWLPLNGTTSSTLDKVSVYALLVGQDNRIYVGSSSGIYRSGLGADLTNWTNFGPPSVWLQALALSPNATSSPADNALFAGTTDGVLRSLNLGVNLSPINEGLPRGLTIPMLATASDRTLFAASGGRAYRSTDAGARWTGIREATLLERITALAPSSNYGVDGSLFLATAGLFCSSDLLFSTNRGAGWTTVQMPSPCRDILLPSPTFQSDNTIIAANASETTPTAADSIVRSFDRGNTWTNLTIGLENRLLYTLAMNPSPGGAPALLAGTNAGIFSLNANTWAPFNGGDIGVATPIHQIAFSPNIAQDKALFALGGAGLYRYNSGATPGWKKLTAKSLPLAEVRSLTVSPNFADDQMLFATSTRDVWISRDGGGSWERIRRSGLPDVEIVSLALAPDFASSRTIFVGANGGGIFKYTLPPPAPAWLVLLYLAGDDHSADSLSEPIDQLRGRLDALANPDVRVVALYDGNQTGDSRIYVRDSSTDGLQAIGAPAVLPGAEWDTGSVATLQNFIRWALDTYPGSRHTMLSIVDHGGGWAPDFGEQGQAESDLAFQAGGWRGMSLDGTSGSSLSTRDTRQALAQALNEGERFDIIFFDACFMGMIESVYEVQPYADYMIVGENILWAALPYERYLAPDVVSASTSPRDLAKGIVKLYNSGEDDLPAPTSQPFTIAALDMQKLAGLPTQVDALAQLLLSRLADLNTRVTATTVISQAYSAAQKFDYDTSFTLDKYTDGYVDLADFARKLYARNLSPDINAAAQAIYTTIGGRGEPDGVVLDRPKIVNGKPNIAQATWDLSNAYGLSIYLPLGEKDCRPSGPPRTANTPAAQPPCIAPPAASANSLIIEPQLKYYVDPNQLAFTQAAPHWAELLKLLDATVPPRDPRKPPFRSPAQLPTEWRRYLPVVAFGARPDLIVADITVVPATPIAGQPAEVRVKIKNVGARDITTPFWVDLYVDLLNPALTPAVNRTWPDISPYGAAWRVYSLGAGDEVTLSTLHPGDPSDPGGRYSFFPGFVGSGAHTLYALVDSYAEGQADGMIAEADERIESNRRGPIAVVVAPPIASNTRQREE